MSLSSRHHELDIAANEPPSRQEAAVLHAEMYALGEKYLIPDLKAYAKKEFGKSFASLPRTQLRLIVCAVYTLTPDTDRDLRDLVVGFAAENIVSLLQCDALSDCVLEHPEFGFEVLQQVVQIVLKKNARSYRSQGCRHCPAMDDDPQLYCKHNHQAESYPIL